MKRNYIFGKYKNSSAEHESDTITFLSNSKGKINLSDSTKDITVKKHLMK